QTGRIANAANHNAGSVTMSPMAVTTGAATLSRSHPRRTATRAVRTVTASTSTLDATPPSTEITRKSMRLMCGIPSRVVISHASMANATETYTVSRHDPASDCPVAERSCQGFSNLPACANVPSRAPNAPKMLPRIPIAAGTSSNNPGNDSNAADIEPNAIPAIRSPVLDNSNAPKPSRRLLELAASARRPRVARRDPRKPATWLSADIDTSAHRSSAATGVGRAVCGTSQPMMAAACRRVEAGVGTPHPTVHAAGPDAICGTAEAADTSRVAQPPRDAFVHHTSVTALCECPQCPVEDRHGRPTRPQRDAVGAVATLPAVVAL